MKLYVYLDYQKLYTPRAKGLTAQFFEKFFLELVRVYTPYSPINNKMRKYVQNPIRAPLGCSIRDSP